MASFGPSGAGSSASSDFVVQSAELDGRLAGRWPLSAACAEGEGSCCNSDHAS